MITDNAEVIFVLHVLNPAYPEILKSRERVKSVPAGSQKSVETGTIDTTLREDGGGV